MTATAIVSDIHSNIHALQAVLDDVRSQGAERIVCLGDVIGYGAHPVECIEIARGFPVCLRGNHEAGVVGRLSDFNWEARKAAHWTRTVLKPGVLASKEKKDRWQFVAGLPESREEDDILFVHGSPRDPVWEYLFEFDCSDLLGHPSERITRNLAMVESLCFVGHTHIPGVIDQDGRFLRVETFDGRFELGPGAKAIVNVGSVGQPRDGDIRASYGILRGRTVSFRRVAYDVEAAMRDILDTRGLPDSGGERLLQGI